MRQYPVVESWVSEKKSSVSLKLVDVPDRPGGKYILLIRKQFMFIEPKDLEDVADFLDVVLEELEQRETRRIQGS